jgi:hypothetical protein
MISAFVHVGNKDQVGPASELARSIISANGVVHVTDHDLAFEIFSSLKSGHERLHIHHADQEDLLAWAINCTLVGLHDTPHRHPLATAQRLYLFGGDPAILGELRNIDPKHPLVNTRGFTFAADRRAKESLFAILVGWTDEHLARLCPTMGWTTLHGSVLRVRSATEALSRLPLDAVRPIPIGHSGPLPA